MPITFDAEVAKYADTGGYISTGGYYKGKFTKALIVDGNDQAKFIEFSFKSDNGEIANFIRINTIKKNGERSFGYAKMMAIMRIFKLQTIEPVSNGTEVCINEFCNRKIGVKLQRVDYKKNNGEIGYKMEVLNFCDYETNKTYSELSQGKDAITYSVIVGDKLIQQNVLNDVNTHIPNDSLPF